MRRFIEASNYSSKRATGDSIDRLNTKVHTNKCMIVRPRRAQHARSEEDSRVQHRIGGALEESIDRFGGPPGIGAMLERLATKGLEAGPKGQGRCSSSGAKQWAIQSSGQGYGDLTKKKA